MGGVAKSGIFKGRKVPLDTLKNPLSPAQQVGCSFLSSAGFGDFAEKCLNKAAWRYEDVLKLLVEAPMPVLMKLAELDARPMVQVEPQPIMVLPLSRMEVDRSESKYLGQFVKNLIACKYQNIRVVCDRIDIKHKARTFEILTQILKCRDDITLAGPTLEDFLRELSFRGSETHYNDKSTWQQLAQILQELAQIGIRSLRPSTSLSAVGLLSELGFKHSVVTPINLYEDVELLAREILELNMLAEQTGAIDVWVPGSFGRGHAPKSAGLDGENYILRVLAVGSLVLRHIPAIRASSRFLSLDAMRVGRLLGANDFGFGATDQQTTQRLGIKPLHMVREAMFFVGGH